MDEAGYPHRGFINYVSPNADASTGTILVQGKFQGRSSSCRSRTADGDMVPIGALAQIKPSVGPSLISLYNLFLSAAVVGAPASGFSSGEALSLMEQTADETLPPGTGYEWTGMWGLEKVAGNQLIYVFALAILLVYLCLAGQYESWIMPFAVILAGAVIIARAGGSP